MYVVLFGRGPGWRWRKERFDGRELDGRYHVRVTAF